MKTKVRISRNSPAEFSLHKAIIAMLLAAGWLMAAGTARATDFYWINPGGGDWADTNNWSPSRIYPPDTGDNVFITAAGTYNVTGGGYADSLTLGDGASSFPTLLLDSAGVFVWGGAYAAPGSRIVLTGGDGSSLFSGGSFEADGGLTLEGEMDWQAGSLNGIVTVTTNGLISGSTSLNHYFTATVHNHGQILWSADNLTCGSGAEIQNMSDGLVDWQNDGAIGGWPGGVICAVINSGTMLKSAGTGILNFNSATLSNSGIVQVESGTLNLYQGLADSGNFAVSDGCALWLLSGTCYFNPGHAFTGEGSYGVPSGGSITLYGTITDPNFQMNGQLYGTNILAGTMNAYDGDFEGATTIASNGVLNVSGCTQCGVGSSTRISGVLTNAGTLNWLSGDWVSEGGTVVNLPGALFTIQCDNIYGNWGGLDNWINQGVIRKSAGTGTNVLYGVALNNSSLVDVQSGGLSFPLGFTSSGTFNVADGAAVPLQGGTYYLNPGNVFTGEGFYGVPAGGYVTLYGTITDTNFQMNGQLYGANILTGTMNAYDGYFYGVTTIASNGVLNVSGCTQCGSSYSTRIGGVLTNAGTINWLSGDWVSYSGTVVNLADALVTIQCDNGYWSWSGPDSWFNAGTIRKFASAGTNYLDGMVLNNVGLVDVQTGGLSLTSLNNAGTFNVASGAAVLLQGGTLSGAFNVADGASVLLQSGTFNLNPGYAFNGEGSYGVPAGSSISLYGTISDTNFQMNGQLYGANILTGTMNAYDGYFGGVTTIASNGVLNVSGCTQCGSSYSTRIGGVLTNAGTINWLSGDWNSYSGTVVNLADALMTVQCDNGYGNWSGLDSWFNAGTIRKFDSAGTNILDGMVLNNAGLVDVQSGALQLQNTYSQTGGELNFGLTGPGEYGHIILAGNAPFTGTLGANLLGGYHPAVGNAFNVLTYASFSGSFTNLNLPDLPGNRGWIENYGDTTTTLIVTKGRIPLAIAQNSGNVTISWTTNADPGFVLQSTTNLAPPVVWQDVPNDVQVIGDQNSVTIPLTDDSVFFRLQE
jgi:hypothetical protein